MGSPWWPWLGLLLALLAQARHYEVVRDHHHGYLLVDRARMMIRLIPDNDTVDYYGFAPASVPRVTRALFNNFHSGPPIPSTKDKDNNADLRTAALVQRALILGRQLDWLEISFLEGMVNPSVLHIGNRTWVTWRKSLYDSPIQLGHLGPPLETRLPLDLPNGTLVRQLAETFDISIATLHFNALQEDPRIFVGASGQVVVHYTCKKSLFSHAMMCFSLLSPPAVEGGVPVSAGLSTWMERHPLSPGQKNWVAVDHGGSLYFLANINPLTVLQFDRTDEHRVGHLHLVYQAHAEVWLPWSHEYGRHIRGGTPTVRISDHLLLAFFHTSVVVAPHGSKTYLMGAIAFCAAPPFTIHAMSPHPILLEKFYEGPWVSMPAKKHQGTDYVMFPTGVSLDDHGKTVHVSFGYNDKHGIVAKFNLVQLLDSLDLVALCPPQAS